MNMAMQIIANRLTAVFCDSCEFEDFLDAAKTLQDHPLCLETMVGDLQAAKELNYIYHRAMLQALALLFFNVLLNLEHFLALVFSNFGNIIPEEIMILVYCFN